MKLYCPIDLFCGHLVIILSERLAFKTNKHKLTCLTSQLDPRLKTQQLFKLLLGKSTRLLLLTLDLFQSVDITNIKNQDLKKNQFQILKLSLLLLNCCNIKKQCKLFVAFSTQWHLVMMVRYLFGEVLLVVSEAKVMQFVVKLRNTSHDYQSTLQTKRYLFHKSHVDKTTVWL